MASSCWRIQDLLCFCLDDMEGELSVRCLISFSLASNGTPDFVVISMFIALENKNKKPQVRRKGFRGLRSETREP